VALLIQETGLKPEYGISLYASSGTADGIRGDHVILAPPYNVTKEEIDIIVEKTEKIVKEVFAQVE
jgi:adenosylmethionine-8-amino-7-oxononanoate aminotransferase